MAIYHLHISYGSRQGGQSAVATFCYVMRKGRYARGRDDLVAAGFGNLPAWCDGDPARLFAAADRHERSNGRLYVELEGALPVELNEQQRVELVEGFLTELTASGLPFVFALHAGRPKAEGEPGNPHFHGLLSERINDGLRRDPALWFRRANRRNPVAGGAAKDRSLKAHAWVGDTRQLYEQLVNASLARAGCPERVTAASHRDRIARAEAVGDHETAEKLLLHPPGVHIGPTARAIELGKPGHPGPPTERGRLARASDAKAEHLRAELERVKAELKEHEGAAVAAAVDAGVDEELVVTAQSGLPDDVIALDVATDRRRQEIRAAAHAVGFDDEAIGRIRREGEPGEPELGWRAVVEATTGRRRRKNSVESAARNAGLDVDALYARARNLGEDGVDFLGREAANREAEIEAEARAVGLDDDGIACIRAEAESQKPGSGLGALLAVTTERHQRREDAESAARNTGLDVDAVYGTARNLGEEPVAFLERATAEREAEIEAVARATLLNREQIVGICDGAELKQPGTGWGAVIREAAKRCQRREDAESAARHTGLDVGAVYAEAGNLGGDPVDFLERATGKRAEAITAAARKAGLNDGRIVAIYTTAESKRPGTGWRAVIEATAERRQRRENDAKSAARDAGVRLPPVYTEARRRGADWLDVLERATADREAEIVVSARKVGLDDGEIARIRDEAESTEAGWNAVVEEVKTRAMELLKSLDFEAVQEVSRIHAGSMEAGLGAFVGATVERHQRKTAESAARDVGVEVADVYAEAGRRGENTVDCLLRETAKRKAELKAAAREVFLDDEAIEGIRNDAESRQAGSGWGAVVEATAERSGRKATAEWAAHAVDLDVDEVYANARKRSEDPVTLLEREVKERRAEILAAARAVWLDDEAIRRLHDGAESRRSGSGWGSVVEATTERSGRKAAVESDARNVDLELEIVCAEARERNEDPLEALEREVRGVRRQRREQQTARREALVEQPAGRALYNAWSTELDPASQRSGGPSGELVDQILVASESDDRLRRLTLVLADSEAASRYCRVAGSDEQVTLEQIDDGLEAAEELVRERDTRRVPKDTPCEQLNDDDTRPDPQARGLESVDSASNVKMPMEKYLRKLARAASAAEAALPATQPDPDRPDYWVPAVSDKTLDRVLDAERFLGDIVEEVRDQYDDSKRRESEVLYLDKATEVKHAPAMTGSQGPSSRTRVSVEAGIRENHWSAVLDAFRAAYRVGDFRGTRDEPALDLDDRARLARYLVEEELPFTTPHPGNPSHRPFAVSDRTLDAAVAAARTRRDADTIAAIRSLHWYTSRDREDSERAYARKRETGPEEVRDVVIKIVEGAWRKVDRLGSWAARQELERRDDTRGGPERPRTVRPATHAERGGPTQDVSSRNTPDKRQVSTRADEVAPTDHEPDRGWRGGR